MINDDVLNCKEIVSKSDLIFMHNVFEFFVPNEIQIDIWKFLKANIKKDAILVTIPSVEEMIKSLFEVIYRSGHIDLKIGLKNFFLSSIKRKISQKTG